MKIQIGRCRTCGKYAYLDEVAGLRAVVGTGPVDPSGRMWDLVAGRLYLLDDQKGLRVARPADLDTPGAVFLAEHEHRGAVRPVEGPAGPPAPCPTGEGGSGPQTAAQVPSWAKTEGVGQQTLPDSVPGRGLPFGLAATAGHVETVTPHPTDQAVCAECGGQCQPGTYVAIQYGTERWASHVDTCPT